MRVKNLKIAEKYDKPEQIVYLVEERPNPSTDCFVLPALEALQRRIVRCKLTEVPTQNELRNAEVIFVRYISRSWARAIQAMRSELQQLVFFMDDDVLDPRASAGMPARYRIKLIRFSAFYKQWLQRQSAALWVSTPYLQQKYAYWTPRLILPYPVATPAEVCRVFYHGTASHDAEIRWLVPIVREVVRQQEALKFELVGTGEVNRLYRDIPRVTVVHPMNWVTYQRFVAASGRQIGLAPLLNTPFNRARSYTKFFDITRSGAAGIYTLGSSVASVVSHGIDGLVLPHDRDAWVAGILRLVQDERLRHNIWFNATLTIQELANAARQTHTLLLSS